MSFTSASLHHCPIRMPRLLPTVLFVLHAVALLACWLNALPLALRGVSALLVILLGGLSMLSIQGVPTKYLSYTDPLGWRISGDGQDDQTITVLPESVVSRELILLHYRQDVAGNQTIRTLFIARSSMAASDYRRLLVKLRHSRNEQDR